MTRPAEMRELRDRIARALYEHEVGEDRYFALPWERAYQASWLRATDAVLAAVETAGWVLVPAEPTEEMLKAGFAAESGAHGDGSVGALVAQWQDEIRAEYLAMIAKRPQ